MVFLYMAPGFQKAKGRRGAAFAVFYRSKAAAISVAAKRLGLGAGAQRYVTDSPYLFERRAEGA
jgi:hypothetical protein